MAWNPDDPFPASAALGETDAGARNLAGYLCSLLEPGPTLVLGSSDVALRAAPRHTVTVVDWSTRRLGALDRFARERGLEIRAICRDLERQELPFPARSFTNVVCVDVLERVSDEVVVLDRLQRLLRPDGRLVARVRACPWVREEAGSRPDPPRHLDPGTLQASLEEAGFRMLRLRHWNFVGVPTALVWDRCLGRPHRDRGGAPASERPRRWWEGGLDAWFRAVENRIGLPVGVSLIGVATPHVERVRVHDRALEKSLARRPARAAYEPMATSR